eukprot:1134585-Rhodomonas_salina.1
MFRRLPMKEKGASPQSQVSRALVPHYSFGSEGHYIRGELPADPMADPAAIAVQIAALTEQMNNQAAVLANTQADLAAARTAAANAQAEAAQACLDAAADIAAAGGAAGAAAPAVANVLKDLKVKLDKFLWHTDPKSVDTWLDNLEDYCMAHSIVASADKTFVAQYHLNCEIKDWFKLFTDSTGVKNNKAMDFD